jgi:Rrf2 family protein
MAPANKQFAIAVHIMAVLGCRGSLCQDENAPVTSSLLAASVNATPSFVRRVLAVLARAGLVKTVRGASGSCSLQKPPEEISLLDIYRAVDAPKVFALHCYPPEERCSVSCRMNKVMSDLLDEAQTGMEQSLGERTLADFISEIHCRNTEESGQA